MLVSSNKTSTGTPSCNDSSNIQETDAFGSHKELYSSQTIPVALIGNALVSLKEDLGSQIRNHGNTIAVTLVKVSLPAGLRSLTFGYFLNQSMEKVNQPVGLVLRQ